jgi:hypothetical protein
MSRSAETTERLDSLAREIREQILMGNFVAQQAFLKTPSAMRVAGYLDEVQAQMTPASFEAWHGSVEWPIWWNLGFAQNLMKERKRRVKELNRTAKKLGL